MRRASMIASASSTVVVFVVGGAVLVAFPPDERKPPIPDSVEELARNLVPADIAKPPDALLTVEETLGIVYQGEHREMFKLFRRANAKAKPALYKVLEDSQQLDGHRMVWWIFGYIGDASDLAELEEYLTVHYTRGQWPGSPQDVYYSMFDCLGLMCARKVPGAREFVDRLLQLQFWRTGPTRYRNGGGPDNASPECDAVRWVLMGYALSLNEDVPTRWQNVLKQVDKPADLEILKRIDPDSFLKHGRMMRSAESAPVTPLDRERLLVYFNGDLENPGPRDQEEVTARLRALAAAQLPRHDPDPSQAQEMYEAGDATVIPVLRKWLVQHQDGPFELRNEAAGHLVTAIKGLAAFRDRESVPTLVRLHRDGRVPLPIRWRAATALARIAGPDVSDDLLKKMMWDLRMFIEPRAAAAAELARRGDSSGRQFLLLQYDLHRLAIASGRSGGDYIYVFDELSRTTDEAILQGLKDRLSQEQHSGAKKNLQTLLSRVELYVEFDRLPLEKLRELVQDTSPESEAMQRRYRAIEALGRRGTAEDVALIEQFKLFDDPAASAPDNVRIPFERVRRASLGEIKRREWAAAQFPKDE